MKTHPRIISLILVMLALTTVPRAGLGQVGYTPPAIVSNTLFVDPAGSDSTGTRGTSKPYLTLAGALSAAAAGDTVVMRPGTYNTVAGMITITQANLHLVGYGAKLVAASQADLTKIEVGANNVTIEGLEIDGQYTDTISGDRGLIDLSDQSNCSILNCYIHRAGSKGIRSTGTCPRLTIDNCRFDTCDQNIYLYSAPNDCRITHNTITSPINTGSSGGIRIVYSGGLGGSGYLIEDNRLVGGFLETIEVWGGHQNFQVLNNIVTGGPSTGISVNNGQNVTVSGNHVLGATSLGIEVAESSRHVLVTNNVVDGFNPSAGAATTVTLVAVSGTTVKDVTISGNTLHNDAALWVGAVHLLGASHIQISGNEFQSDTLCINVQQTNNVLIQGNKFRAATEDAQIPNHVIFLDASGSTQMGNIQIMDNVFYGGSQGSFVCFYSGTASVTSAVRITNNTATSATPTTNATCNSGYYQFYGGTITNVVVDGNLPAATNGDAGHSWFNTPPVLELPTSDPHILGQTWNNGGVVTISNG